MTLYKCVFVFKEKEKNALEKLIFKVIIINLSSLFDLQSLVMKFIFYNF